MLLGPKPATVLTHEQNIAWSLSEIISELENPTLSDALFPVQVTESQGYYPSEVISVQPVRTVDGGFRHIYRVLMPIAAASYAGSKAVWDFVKPIAPGMSRIGLGGVVVPGKSDRVRYNPDLSNGSVEYQSGLSWINIASGSNVRHAWIGGDGNIYIRVVDGTYYYVSPPNWGSGWVASTEAVYKAQITAIAAIRL
jgi:hypothetical protein